MTRKRRTQVSTHLLDHEGKRAAQRERSRCALQQMRALSTRGARALNAGPAEVAGTSCARWGLTPGPRQTKRTLPATAAAAPPPGVGHLAPRASTNSVVLMAPVPFLLDAIDMVSERWGGGRNRGQTEDTSSFGSSCRLVGQLSWIQRNVRQAGLVSLEVRTRQVDVRACGEKAY